MKMMTEDNSACTSRGKSPSSNRCADRFATIFADPSWPYRVRPPEGGLPYSSLPLKCIEGLGTQTQALAANDAHLYLCVPKDHLRFGFGVLDAWGFAYQTILVWDKLRMGMGFRYFRNQVEFVLFGVRGRSAPPIARRDLTNIIYERSREHSRKPEALYQRIEAASPGPRLELFARRRRAGWYSWGNEVSSDIALVVPCFTSTAEVLA